MTANLSAFLRRYGFWAALFLFFVGLSVQYTYKIMQPDRSAFERWVEMIRHLDDEDLTRKYNYPNPPIMAIILEPLANLPRPWGALIWFYLKVGMTLAAFSWVFRMVATPERPFPDWAKVLTVLLSLRTIVSDLSHGNVNLFILFLVVALLYAFRRGRDFLSGNILGLAIACKLTPALFLPYFIWKKAWKAAGGCAVGLLLFLVVVPGLRLGMRSNLDRLQSWAKVMVVPYVLGGQVTTDHPNQSLPGLAYRLLTDSPAFSTYVNNIYTPVSYYNIAAWDPALVRWLLKGCMVLFAGLVIWTCRTPTANRRGWRLVAEYGVVLLGMLLFSERTWKHHCVVFVVPFAVLCYYLAQCRPGRGLRTYLIGTISAAVLLMASTSTGLLGNRSEGPAELAQVYGAFVWVYVLLLASLVVLLRRDARERAAALSLSIAASEPALSAA